MEYINQLRVHLQPHLSKMERLDTCQTAVIATAAVLLLSVLYYWIKNRNVLPGPKGVPYLGLLPFLKEEDYFLKLDEYKKTYGDLFSFTYSGTLFINLGSVKAMREVQVAQADCFGGRPEASNILVNMLKNGIGLVNGEPWKVLRRFFIQRLKDLGLNSVKENLAGPVYDTLQSTVEDIKKSGNKPVNIVKLLAKGCTVTMRKVLFGEDGVTDEELASMINAYTEAISGNLGLCLLLSGPLASFLFATVPSFRKNFQRHWQMGREIMACCKKLEKNMKDGEATCLVEDFYRERDERRRKNDPTWKYFTDAALLDSMLQFVGDGILSVAGVIAGFLNGLLEHPEEQEKIYAELMEVVGPNRQPTLEDRVNLPYTNAFLSEYLRFNALFPIFPSLECTKATTVRGYTIPKGAITLLNIYSAHRDEATFEDAGTFKPSRYIASPGKPKAENPVAFGMGKRSCTGEPFVMLECFLFLSTIVKNFKIVSSNAPPYSSADYMMQGKLELKFVPRTEK